MNRKEKTVIIQLRIGNTHLMHSLITHDEPPLWNTCGIPLTVNHIITKYQKQHYSNQYHISEQICQTLRPNSKDTKNLVSYFKQFELYNLI